MITNEKKRVLQQFLNISDDNLDELKQSEYEKDGLEYGKEEYLVLTEEEADARAKETIANELWAFNADFLLRHNKNCDEMNNWEWDAAIETIRKAQGKLADSLNGLARCLISDLDEFVEDAICEDGRGRFLAIYDGYENEEVVEGVTYYIYRIG